VSLIRPIILHVLNETPDVSVEMRHSVTTPAYMLRKMLDDILYSLSPAKHVSVATLGPLLSRILFSPQEPSGWIPLYTMVTFRPDISYATAKKKAERQSRLISTVGWVGTAFLGITSLGITWLVFTHRLRS
jgi:kynurenine 3-monooxygenase